jgi:ABC-2 type transport system ATP-binding protein
MFGLLGPNGAGKTTTMRIVLGVLDADSGDVLWRGRPVGVAERRRFGFLPEERGLYPRMRVRDHIVYLARLHGLSRRAGEREADRLLGFLELADRASDRVEQLSHGNRQRVQLAGVLAHDPEVLVLDEPFGGLDPLAVRSLVELLMDRAAAGCTVLFSSHQLDLVEDLCQRVAVIDAGRLVLCGDVADLKAAAGRRILRVAVDTEAARWVPEGGRVVSSDARGVRLLLDAADDPLTIIDAARRVGRVRDFALELPSLNDLFLEAVGG